MIVKNIQATITKKVKDWIDSIEDESLRTALTGNVIVTGGCIPSLLEDVEVNDYDVYFRTKEVTLKVANYYVDEFIKNPPKHSNNAIVGDITVKEDDDGRIKIHVQSNGVAGIDKEAYNKDESEDLPDELFLDQAQNENPISYIEKSMGVKTIEGDLLNIPEKKYVPLFISSNAITLSNKVQLVIRFYGEPEEIHLNYDFIHCTNYWVGGKLTLKKDALSSLMTKELRYTGSRYPLCSIIRTRKFIKRGFMCNAGQYLKMAMQLNDLDLKDVNVLEDQLCGVDVAYFQMLIEEMRQFGKNKGDENKIDTDYLMEVIDKMF